MNLLDVLILLAVAIALANGVRRGFSLSAASYIGLVAGTAIGAYIAPWLERSFASGSTAAPIIGLGLMFICASIGSSLGYAIGEPIRARIRNRHVGRVDSTLGGIFSAFTVLATAWFLGIAFARGPIPALSRQVESSRILTTLSALFPHPPGFLVQVEQIIAAVPYPRVFDTLTNPDLPGPVSIDPAVANLPGVTKAAQVTVKIRSLGCGGEVFGSGFPVASDYVVSNAHVVAGTSDHRVIAPDGRSLRATVVLFDPETDISILHVPGLRLSPLVTAGASRGTSGATIGYPGGGNETIRGAAVRTRVPAEGRDIYGQNLVTREIYVLQADIHPGNSGGPFVSAQGNVLGVVFANSTTNPAEGYALTDAEVAPDISSGVGRTAPVSTSSCAS